MKLFNYLHDKDHSAHLRVKGIVFQLKIADEFSCKCSREHQQIFFATVQVVVVQLLNAAWGGFADSVDGHEGLLVILKINILISLYFRI